MTARPGDNTVTFPAASGPAQLHVLGDRGGGSVVIVAIESGAADDTGLMIQLGVIATYELAQELLRQYHDLVLST